MDSDTLGILARIVAWDIVRSAQRVSMIQISGLGKLWKPNFGDIVLAISAITPTCVLISRPARSAGQP